MTATVYTIPPGFPFADALAQGLIDQNKGNDFPLSQLELYLPNRRSCRTVSESFLKLTDGAVTILPRLNPIGDVDQDELILSDIAGDLSLDEPIAPLARQFLLAQLIMKRGDLDLSYDQAMRLALDLARLIDQIDTYGLSTEELHKLVPDAFADHWKITLDFLNIIIQALPDILRERGVSNPSQYRNNLLALKTARLKDSPPSHPIIAAGTTGSIPATAEFLSAIAHLPNGCVILPGLDQNLDDESWDKHIEESHPQYNLKNLLNTIGISRGDVKIWPSLKDTIFEEPKAKRVVTDRAQLMSDMARPADTTQKWKQIKLDETCVEGLTQVNAQTPQEESQIIALMMREVLETPKKTALLITPDRSIAGRVAADLKRWHIDIDDSAGVALPQTPLGHFLTLTAHLLCPETNSVTLLELLKHPLCRLNYDEGSYHNLLYSFEKDVIRGPKLDGFSAFKQKVETIEEEDKRKQIISFIDHLISLFQPNQEIETLSFDQWIDRHLHLSHALATQGDLPGQERLWQGEVGEAAATLFTDLRHGVDWYPEMSAEEYGQMVLTLMEQVTIRPRYQKHPRLKILSPIEGRLQTADLIILAGINEGVWPIGAQNDPWMSRPMRKDFGLPGLEQQIGLSAHDFCQHLCAPRVVLTRSIMNDGAETVPSRWLLRLNTVLKQAGIENNLLNANDYHVLAQKIDQTDSIAQAPQPEPRPPVGLRPRKLSATAIETWIRDPYSIYARYILKLKKLDGIEEDKDRLNWGIYVHKVLELFINQKHDIYSDKSYDILVDIADKELSNYALRQEQRTQWQLKFKNIAQWFITYEKEQTTIKERLGEREGSIQIANDKAPFTLTGKADRLDRDDQGNIHIIDYKTGTIPTGVEVGKGYAPQLPLMGLMAQENGFNDMEGENVTALTYYKISGKTENPVKVSSALAKEKITVEAIINETKGRLIEMINAFDNLETPYWSIPNFNTRPRYNDYEHLARIQEWSSGDDDDGGDV